MDPILFPLFMLVVVLLVFAAVNHFSRDERLKRQLRAAESVPIGQVNRDSVVKISGQVKQLDRLLEAPLTGRSCVFYRVLVEERIQSGKNSRWRTLIDEYEATDFLVTDATAVARINVAGADPVLVLDAHFTSGTWNDAEPALERYLARFGEKSTGLLGFNRKIRYREAVLEPGEGVAVLGAATMELDPDSAGHAGGGYRARPERPVLARPEEGSLLLSDDPSVIDGQAQRFTPSANRSSTRRPLVCPHCGASAGFRTLPTTHVCLTCHRSFDT